MNQLLDCHEPGCTWEAHFSCEWVEAGRRCDVRVCWTHVRPEGHRMLCSAHAHKVALARVGREERRLRVIEGGRA